MEAERSLELTFTREEDVIDLSAVLRTDHTRSAEVEAKFSYNKDLGHTIFNKSEVDFCSLPSTFIIF